MQKKIDWKKLHILVCAALFLGGCSVEYSTVYENEDFIPELMLDEAAFSRTEQGRTTTLVTSERLEEFKNSGKILAQEIQFETKNNSGDTTATGSAGLMSADTQKEIYEFYNGIKIESKTHNVKITGQSLKWNGKTEQLIGERSKEITIEKDGASLSGQGFSASAVSEQFSFASEVHGTYTDKGEAEAEAMSSEQ